MKTTETQLQKASPELLRIFQAMSQTSVAVVVQGGEGGHELFPGVQPR